MLPSRLLLTAVSVPGAGTPAGVVSAPNRKLPPVSPRIRAKSIAAFPPSVIPLLKFSAEASL
jgi:hypothetical protein